MGLHRTGRKADWQRRPRRQWNWWQQLAGRTGGVVTAGNVLTVAGTAGVLAGLLLVARQRYAAGLALLVAGRLCDVLDGWLADRTGTKSPLGEKLDATADKLQVGAALVILTAAGMLPLWAVLTLFVPHLIIATISLAAYRSGLRLQPSWSGKLSMAAAWTGMAGFVALQASRPDTGQAAGGIWLAGASAVVVLSVILAFYAAAGYARKLWRQAGTR